MDALSTDHGVRVDYLLTQAGSRQTSREGWFSARALTRLVPDVAERVVYVCGPEGMTAAVVRSLEELGVDPDHIRTEVFRLQ
jgi:ferredoxin-NADP reductase